MWRDEGVWTYILRRLFLASIIADAITNSPFLRLGHRYVGVLGRHSYFLMERKRASHEFIDHHVSIQLSEEKQVVMVGYISQYLHDLV